MYFTSNFTDGIAVYDRIIKQLENAIVSIPVDPNNDQYKEYLAWVEEGNVAEEWVPDHEH